MNTVSNNSNSFVNILLDKSVSYIQPKLIKVSQQFNSKIHTEIDIDCLPQTLSKEHINIIFSLENNVHIQKLLTLCSKPNNITLFIIKEESKKTTSIFPQTVHVNHLSTPLCENKISMKIKSVIQNFMAVNPNLDKEIKHFYESDFSKPYNEVAQKQNNKDANPKLSINNELYCEVNYDYINQEFMGNERICKLYIRSFIKEFEEFLETSSYYASQLECQNIYNAAHKILPSTKTFLLTEIIELLEYIHDNSKQNIKIDYENVIAKIKLYYASVNTQLNDKLSKL